MTVNIMDNHILIKEVWGVPYYYSRKGWEGIIENATHLPLWQLNQIASKINSQYGEDYKVKKIN